MWTRKRVGSKSVKHGSVGSARSASEQPDIEMLVPSVSPVLNGGGMEGRTCRWSSATATLIRGASSGPTMEQNVRGTNENKEPAYVMGNHLTLLLVSSWLFPHPPLRRRARQPPETGERGTSFFFFFFGNSFFFLEQEQHCVIIRTIQVQEHTQHTHTPRTRHQQRHRTSRRRTVDTFAREEEERPSSFPLGRRRPSLENAT